LKGDGKNMSSGDAPIKDEKPSRMTVLGDLDKPIFDDSEFGKSMKEYYAAKAKTLEALMAKTKSESGVSGEREQR